jgi:hypothetical protein
MVVDGSRRKHGVIRSGWLTYNRQMRLNLLARDSEDVAGAFGSPALRTRQAATISRMTMTRNSTFSMCFLQRLANRIRSIPVGNHSICPA